ncbi:sensor histidine kinase [Nostoc sp. MG11]|uniref:sensor histidine kinase n=1 Tax=Nostoc sp. MG11 TaxID=2721166 RepID=UPI0018674067|nr:HAMP domain-containing sensor histidine kinase [Nostoc sp. MG11]
MNDPITADIFAALNILVLERLNVNLFKINGTVPNWLTHCYKQKFTTGMEIFILQEGFHFLENFLIDAEEFWQSDRTTKLSSGLWIDTDLTGKECHFEASAICVNNKKILLIELLNETYQEKLYIIQKARENQLNYQQWLKDNQKKEVLIHCIIHDMAGQLSSINCCLSLLEFENLTDQGKERLEIGMKQSMKQQMLIRDILNAFSADIQSLESFTCNIAQAPDILISVQEVIELLNPICLVNNIQFQIVADLGMKVDWKVIGDQSRLNRVISNLLENALRYSPPESTITIGLQQDEEYILVTIDDEGAGVQPEMVETLFEKFSQGKTKPGKSGLGLYFCRITVERWGGVIGYLPLPKSGSRFWLSLPKP